MAGRLATRRRLRVVVACWLLTQWSIAWAAVASLRETHPDLIGLPWAQAGVGVLIALSGGVASTLMRYAASKHDTDPRRPFHKGVEAAKDASAAVAIGIAGYYLGWANSLPDDELAAYLVFGGFGAARILSAGAAIYERHLGGLKTRRDAASTTANGDLT